ncbi:DNA-directed RNA polymerase III subunit RPC4, partial [Dillenia turbinata]
GPTNAAFGYGATSNTVKSYGDVYASVLKTKDEYQEPWNYYSYYPVTLPLRRPYSGNPDDLDEDEFGKARESMDYDEDSAKPASELGLLVDNGEETMIFLQFPTTMPMKKRLAAEKGQENFANTKPRSVSRAEKTCGLQDLPAGQMGKILVYRGGAIKLKLGDTLYDVSQGMNCAYAEDVVAINTEKKQCCSVGELRKRVIITPDIESILDSIELS